jgi:hypothetical protein
MIAAVVTRFSESPAGLVAVTRSARLTFDAQDCSVPYQEKEWHMDIRSEASRHYRRIITVALASAIFGHATASAEPRTSGTGGEPTASQVSGHDALLKRHQHGDKRAIRVREDTARHRLWVLGLDQVYVYDTRTRALLREIALPDWSVARFICPPDMTLDRKGGALVTSNVQPRLLHIDGASFRAQEHQLDVVSKRQWEPGFGALAFGSDGSLYAMSSLAGMLFKIDLATRTARELLSADRAAHCELGTLR